MHTACEALCVGAAAPAPAAPPTDPMGFPPGLIPELVRESLRTEEPYAPLELRDIERAGLPDAEEPDSLLRARIDRFYAELQARPASDCSF